MRKASKFLILLVLAIFIMSSVFTGCAGGGPTTTTQKPGETTTANESAATTTESVATTASASTSADISEPADLLMYLIGAPAVDYGLVLDEANKKLKTDLNATLTVNWVGWADFGTQYPLLLASGDPIDLIYASTWTNYYSNAQKGAFMAIEDLVKVYAPLSYAETTPDFIAQSTVGGHLYALPPSFFQYANMGYIVRGDLMKKYGMTTIDTMDDYGKYLAAVVANDPDLDPAGFISSSDGLDTYFAADLGLYSILKTQYSPFWVDINDPESKIFNLYERPEVPAYFAKMKEWSDNGYWSKSILSNKDDRMFIDGKAASRLHNQDSFRSAYIERPEWDVQFYTNGTFTNKTAAMQDGMAIPAAAKNPERALMFLEKLRQDQSYYNLFTYGIEGKHYEITADDKLKALDLEAFAPEGYCSWGFKSLKFYKEPVGSPPTLPALRAKLEGMAIDNKFILFTPDFEPVKNEMAAVNNVIQQYRLPLSYGYVDPVAGLATLNENLKTAGSEVIIAEMQKQLDAFLKN